MNTEELSHYWDEKWDHSKNKAPNPFALQLLATLKNKTNINLLELGCGDGRDTKFFIENNFNVSTVDIASKSVEEIKTKFQGNVNASCQDIRELSFEDNSFDVIYAHLSLHYFTDGETVKIFDKIYSLLRKDGMFFVKCKSTSDPLYGVGEKIAEDTFFKGHIRHFFSLDYLKAKLSKFDIIELEEDSGAYGRHDSSFVYAIVRK